MSDQDWDEEMSSYELDDKTTKAIEVIRPHLEVRNHFSRLVKTAAELAIADLIEVGYADWSMWDPDDVVESVKKVAEEFTEEILDDAQAAIEIDSLIAEISVPDDELDVMHTLRGVRQGMLDLMSVSQHYLIIHETTLEFCNNEE